MLDAAVIEREDRRSEIAQHPGNVKENLVDVQKTRNAISAAHAFKAWGEFSQAL